MGEPQGWLFEPSFNRAVKVEASDERITSDGGFLLLREADHRLGLTEWLQVRFRLASARAWRACCRAVSSSAGTLFPVPKYGAFAMKARKSRIARG